MNSLAIHWVLKINPSRWMIIKREISNSPSATKTIRPFVMISVCSGKTRNGILLSNWKIKTVTASKNDSSRGSFPICGMSCPSRSICLKMGRDISPEYKFLKKFFPDNLTKAIKMNETDKAITCHSFWGCGRGSGLKEMGSSLCEVKNLVSVTGFRVFITLSANKVVSCPAVGGRKEPDSVVSGSMFWDAGKC